MNNTIFISFVTIVRKEINRFIRIWSQTLLPPVITQSLYFIIFGSFIGSQLEDINGLPYRSFIVPGLVMMSVITASYTNAVSSFYLSKFQKNIEELLVSPTPNWVIVLGYVAGSVLRGLLVGIIVFAVSFFFVRPEVQYPLIVLLFVILTATVFSLAGLLNGIFATKFDDISIFPTFVLTPLTYLGGVFYSIDRLDEIWQNASRLNPILYMVNGFRFGFYGEKFSDVNVLFSFLMIIFFVIILTAVNLYHLNKGTGLRS